METKSETDLIISDKDVMVKQRIAIRIQSSGRQIVEYQYSLAIRSVKARDKNGELSVTKTTLKSIQIKLDRDLKKGEIYAFEISMLVVPEITKIGQISIYNWGALDLYRVITLRQPFQVLGFSKFSKENGNWIYSNNLSQNIAGHITRFRNARVEMGRALEIELVIRYDIDCTNGSNIHQFSSFGPVSSKRQKTTLLTPNVKMEMRQPGLPHYILTKPVKQGERRTLELKWRVSILPQPQVTDQLGSMKALEIATTDSPKLKEYISGDNSYWNTKHPLIQQISKKTSNYEQIFDVHQYLFEFSNRRIKYEANAKRLSPVEALQSRIGDCSEYADLLVTLLRAAGVPARVVEGVIIDDKNPTEGHAWVEFLSTNGWISSDPTWGLHLGITCQHIEFNRQNKFRISSVYETEFQGPQPDVSYEILWNTV